MGNKPIMRFEDDNIIIQVSEEGMIISRKRQDIGLCGSCHSTVDGQDMLVLDAEESISFTQQFNMGQMAIQQASPMTGLAGYLNNRILGGDG